MHKVACAACGCHVGGAHVGVGEVMRLEVEVGQGEQGSGVPGHRVGRGEGGEAMCGGARVLLVRLGDLETGGRYAPRMTTNGLTRR